MMRTRAPLVLMVMVLGVTLGAAQSHAQDRFADATVDAAHVAGSVYLLRGVGGNVGASIGPDGTFLIDDDYSPMSERLLAKLDELGGGRPKLILNTHVHADHVGGNEFFGGTGVILAHENVQVRLLGDAAPRAALPIVTFSDRLRLHFNDDQIDIFHVPAGHTDGDSIVWFRQADVVHMGDQFWNGLFPRIDTEVGGSVDGYVANIERVLTMIGEDTHVIPGHGVLGGKAELAAAADMIRQTRQLVDTAVAEGRLEELIKTGLGERWQSWGVWFIKEDAWIRTLAATSPDG
jgi:glyoxylase-like metal-dependent hydrolase (beta-lactamase superfamily II)